MALETFGKRLRVLRIDRDLSQIELRDKMERLYGVSIGETYISELERTDKMPGLQVAAAMARVLDVSLDYLGLVIDEPLPFTRAPLPDPYFSPEADELAKMVDTMHPSQRQVLLSVAQSMLTAPSKRALETAAYHDILESIEDQFGEPMRREIEKMMRGRGLIVNSTA